jgi:hypothetical protein
MLPVGALLVLRIRSYSANGRRLMVKERTR